MLGKAEGHLSAVAAAGRILRQRLGTLREDLQHRRRLRSRHGHDVAEDMDIENERARTRRRLGTTSQSHDERALGGNGTIGQQSNYDEKSYIESKQRDVVISTEVSNRRDGQRMGGTVGSSLGTTVAMPTDSTLHENEGQTLLCDHTITVLVGEPFTGHVTASVFKTAVEKTLQLFVVVGDLLQELRDSIQLYQRYNRVPSLASSQQTQTITNTSTPEIYLEKGPLITPQSSSTNTTTPTATPGSVTRASPRSSSLGTMRLLDHIRTGLKLLIEASALNPSFMWTVSETFSTGHNQRVVSTEPIRLSYLTRCHYESILTQQGIHLLDREPWGEARSSQYIREFEQPRNRRCRRALADGEPIGCDDTSSVDRDDIDNDDLPRLTVEDINASMSDGDYSVEDDMNASPRHPGSSIMPRHRIASPDRYDANDHSYDPRDSIKSLLNSIPLWGTFLPFPPGTLLIYAIILITPLVSII